MLLPFKEQISIITVDNGKEFAHHKKIADALNTEVYFADPYRSWKESLMKTQTDWFGNTFPKTLLQNIDEQQTIFVENFVSGPVFGKLPLASRRFCKLCLIIDNKIKKFSLRLFIAYTLFLFDLKLR